MVSSSASSGYSCITNELLFLGGALIKEVGSSGYPVLADILIPKFPGNYDRCAVVS
jgi:hypothetical protein